MSAKIKLTITGASGVGKSTLAAKLATELDLPLIPEIARQVCAELGHSRIGDIPDQEGFKRLVLEKQIAREQELDSFISDRSAIDCWVLWQRWNICSAMTYDTEAIYNRVQAHAKSYTHIVYIPALFPPIEDEFRWIEPDYIKQIDRIIRMTFYELDLWRKVLTINSDQELKRLAKVKAWLAKSEEIETL